MKSTDQSTGGSSANTINVPSGNVASSEHSQFPSINRVDLGSAYSNTAPVRSISSVTAPSHPTETRPETSSTLKTCTVPPDITVSARCACSNSRKTLISGGPGSSRHFFKIKNASSHEAMFILCAHTLGIDRAHRMADKFDWHFDHPVAALLNAINDLNIVPS